MVLTPAEPTAGSGVGCPAQCHAHRVVDGALRAARGRAAHRRAEIHQHLIPRPAVAVREQGRRRTACTRFAVNRRAGDASEKAGDVRLDDCVVVFEGEHAHGPCGVGADAGKGEQGVELLGNVTAVPFDDRRGGIVEIARPPWVAEALPEPQDLAQ